MKIRQKNKVLIWTLIINLTVALGLALLVFLDYWHVWMLLVWLINLIVLFRMVIVCIEWTERRKRLLLQGLIVAFLPVIVRLWFYNPGRIHGDDMLTAYFSAHFNLVKDNFFGAVPTNQADWFSQFPTVYFVAQKITFKLIGVGLFQTLVSTLPYVYITGFSLYLLGTFLLKNQLGLLAVLLYSFFPPSLYLETIGLIFNMSPALYGLLLLSMVAHWGTRQKVWAMAIGIFTGFAYLGYIGAYIAMPIVVGYFVGLLIIKTKDRKRVFQQGILMFISFLIVWLPFGAYLLSNNYMVQRTNQVALVGGEWSPEKESSMLSPMAWQALKNHTINSLRALVIDNLAGGQGFNFGSQRFFQPISMALFIVGTISVLYIMVIKRQWIWLIILVSIMFSFCAIIFSIPPPSFHRFSLAFPLIALVMSAAFLPLVKTKGNKYLGFILIVIVIGGYEAMNYSAFIRMVNREIPNDTVMIANEVINRCGQTGRKWYVAAFPGFALDRVLYVLDPIHRQALTDYHKNFINNFNRQEKYCYVVLFPQEFDKIFTDLDYSGKILTINKSYSLFMN